MQIRGYSLHRADVRLRMPFRYGIATMTEGPVLFVRLEVELDGGIWTGLASDLLPPKWFTKIPDKPIADEITEMLTVIRRACELAVGRSAATPFALWQGLAAAQSDWASSVGIPPLLANFGVSLVERALIEATARAWRQSFAPLLRSNALGIELGSIHAELGGHVPADFLPSQPLSSIIARHTVGLADPLVEAEIGPADRLEDGLPQSLEAGIRAYGLRHFKIKVNGDLARDVDRLCGIARVLQGSAPPDYAFSLDGNEQFKSFEQFREFWNAAQARPELGSFFRHLLFLEQPLHRDVALRPEVARALSAWKDRPPVIIDESDATPVDLRTALALGYAGTSHKNCKGIFKGVAHRCLLEQRRRAEPGGAFLMSGEDLCNTGPVALLQDLAAMAALGIESVERNGHHYHTGLSQFPAPVQEAVLGAHGDLYQRTGAGWPALRVEGGRVALGSVNRAPFGVGFELDTSLFARG